MKKLNPHRKNLGFTLLELIVVLAIIVTLSYLIIAQWPGTRPNLNAQAQQFAQAIRYTQSYAMSQNKGYRLNFSTNGSGNVTYTITDLSGTTLADPSTGASTITFSNMGLGTVTNLPNNLIAFDSRGYPCSNSSATTRLSNNATIALTSGGATTTVTILSTTGNVSIS